MACRAMTWSMAVLLVAAGLVGCSEPEPDDAVDSDDPVDTPTAGSGSDGVADTDCSGDALFDCARASTIAELVPDGPVAASGEPIRLGMINQENTPAGSFPELSQAVGAGVDFVNEQLGGIDGRPIEVTVCNTEFSVEGSTACGQRFAEAEVPAVLGGIDVFGNAVDVLEDNQIPYVGGIPVSTQSMGNANSYQWSGGTWGATVAFAEYAATELDAQSVAIVYGDFGSVAEGAEYGRSVLEGHGIRTQMVPFPIVATDISSALQAAAADDPDAIFVLAADTTCKPALEGVAALGIDTQAFFVGACAAPAIIDDVDTAASDGAIFNVEGPIGTDRDNPDFDLYAAVVERYADGLDPVGAGTVSFRSFMNLYAVLRRLGADDVTPAAIAGALESQVDAPSFMGHPYTCDQNQFAGLPAACSPQQILGQMDDRELVAVSDWIDVGAAYSG